MANQRRLLQQRLFGGKEMTKDQITNKELQDLLKQYPDDAMVSIEYCNIRELKYYEDKNLIVID